MMFRVLVYITVVLIAGVLAEDAITVVPPPYPIQPTAVVPNTTTSTPAPTTTTTTPKPSTTTTKPSTTTTKPTSTTTSTTPKPTPPSTSTPAPSTTTLAPPTPTPTPDNKPGIWNVTEGSNHTVACVVASMYVNILVPYVKADKNSTTNATKEISVPSNAMASGHCGNDTQSLTLSWKEADASLTLSFIFEKKSSEFTMSSIQATIPADKDLFPGIAANATAFNLTSLNASATVPLHQSYLCVAGVNFTMVDFAHKNATAVPTLILKHVQFQAFANSKENKFDTALDCAAVPYVTPDMIPIFVGVALAALVAAVLVAYVIGRRRSAARGYLSM